MRADYRAAMHELSLRDEVFLLAHDDSGRLRVAEAGLGVGLAGATLIELLLHRRIAVVEGRLEVIDPVMSGRPEADDTVQAIRDNTAPCGPRAWVSWISHGAYGRAAEALESAGVITRTTTRLLGVVPVQRCVPTDLDDIVRVRSRVRFAVHGRDLPDERRRRSAGSSGCCGWRTDCC